MSKFALIGSLIIVLFQCGCGSQSSNNGSTTDVVQDDGGGENDSHASNDAMVEPDLGTDAVLDLVEDSGGSDDDVVDEDAGDVTTEDIAEDTGEPLDPPCTFYVNLNVAEAGDGTSPETAFDKIQDGINAAFQISLGEFVCTVQVAAGTYVIWESEHEDAVVLRERVQLRGGYAPDFSERDAVANESILVGRASPTEPVAHAVVGAHLALLDGFTIQGASASGTGEDNPLDYGAGVFNVDNSFTVSNCVIKDNYASDGGAGIYNNGAGLTVTGCTFENNHSFKAGGGIFNDGDDAAFADCVFLGNHASTIGGGLYNTGAGLQVANCTFRQNESWDGGGGLASEGPGLEIMDSTFEANTTRKSGAGLSSVGANFQLTGTVFRANVADDQAGGADIGAGAQIVGCVFETNEAIGGAGLVARDQPITLAQTNFSLNHAERNGGAVQLIGADLSATDCTFGSNEADYTNGDTPTPRGYGGAIYQLCERAEGEPRCTLTLAGCTFSQNLSHSAGGAISQEGSETVITDSRFVGNTTGAAGGGAIRLDAGSLSAERSIFASNVAVCVGFCSLSWGEGGAIYVRNNRATGALSVSECLFWRNEADRGGVFAADAYSEGSLDMRVERCTIYGNTAPDGGAVLRVGAVALTLVNNIFWNHAADSFEFRDEPVAPSITHNNLDSSALGSDTPDPSNQSGDPRFQTPDGTSIDDVDLSLRDDSPCIDAGDSTDVTAEIDLAGNPRMADGDGSGSTELDMGAYEFQGE